MRPQSLFKLLKSVGKQSLYPDEILIIDGSLDNQTKEVLEKNTFKNLKYFLVDTSHRGLTKQRNFGISQVSNNIDVVCFLDDDAILNQTYFEVLINTYQIYPNALGVGGYITNEVTWKKSNSEFKKENNDFVIDGYVRKIGMRFLWRKKLGLFPNCPPCFMPDFSNGLSIGFLPPSGKIYKAEYFIGAALSFSKSVFNKINFSNYFEGYGLYEDLDFCIRVSQIGSLYVNTAAQLEHFHEAGGRPNKFNYGKMVIRNGWYVWRVYNPNPSIRARLKWHLISLLLTLIKFSNIFTTAKKKEAFTEALGRTVAWWQLLFNKPNVEI